MFKDVLKQLREKRGLTQSQLADEIGVTAGTIGNYEQGSRLPKDDKAWIRIANFFNVTIDYLMDADNVSNNSNSYPEIIASSTGSIDDIFPNNTPHKKSSITPAQTVQLPIYGNVAAGMGAYADNDIIGYEDIPQEWIRGKGDYVLLRVQGDSMYPVFMENDLLLVKCQPIVDNGSYAVVLIDDDSGVVKRVIRGNGYVELQSVNPMYAPRRFEGANMERLRIFGLVKKSIRNYE